MEIKSQDVHAIGLKDLVLYCYYKVKRGYDEVPFVKQLRLVITATVSIKPH